MKALWLQSAKENTADYRCGDKANQISAQAYRQPVTVAAYAHRPEIYCQYI